MFWLGIFSICLIFIAFWSLDIIEFDFSSWQNEHKHNWKIRGAHSMYKRQTIHGVPVTPVEEGEPITIVLWGCECSAIETTEEEGHWSLEQLTNEPVQENTEEEK